MSIIVETFDTLAEAARAIGGDGRYLGGGTLVMRAANYGDQSFRRIIRVRDQGLRRIAAAGDRIEIGAGATMADVMASRDLAFLEPVARAIGGPAVRQMATVGGNLFAAHPYGDFATALLALDGKARMADGRETPLEELLARRDGAGLVASVSIARPRDGEFRFRKVSRVKPKGVSVMAIAAWLPGAPGRIAGARVAFGAMGPAPARARAVERALEGAALDESGIARALAAATEGLDPPDDPLASAWYRREVAPVHLRRLLLEDGRR
ncbi:xanthine dehydrogenase family protein subunit M [Pikeienuella piscinae]|uniref:Xanthine dehydrogenase family protein subunit M n=1 Tax=Pikeienuella piscinae TaxID=2748098 RepID=A0A7L5C1R3_9RHOB|nr:FAD binding domain-containing protein [Pikeienuella piscinae]QIE55799.1 xanthine dehydrogenase family protein subunit M [Pikeienuella piscinae]